VRSMCGTVLQPALAWEQRGSSHEHLPVIDFYQMESDAHAKWWRHKGKIPKKKRRLSPFSR
jgi:hypothetical protein